MYYIVMGLGVDQLLIHDYRNLQSLSKLQNRFSGYFSPNSFI